MRTLKFRYWNTITKEMVNNPKMPYKENWTIEQLFEDRGWVWMQFTGLTDRHGVEIYEGDIVELHSWKPSVKETKRQIVEWHGSGLFMRRVDGTVSGYAELPDARLEVIGNIYENPELLER